MALGKDRYDTRRSEGDMEYCDDTGLFVPVSGTATTGYVPTKQADGTVAWAAAPGASGSGASIRCIVRKSTTTTGLTTSAYTALTFDTEDADTDTMHSAGTNPERVTINTSGTYAVSGGFGSTGAITAQVLAAIYKNGTMVAAQATKASAEGIQLSVFRLIDLVATDYLELRYYTPTNFTIAADSSSPRLEVVKLAT